MMTRPTHDHRHTDRACDSKLEDCVWISIEFTSVHLGPITSVEFPWQAILNVLYFPYVVFRLPFFQAVLWLYKLHRHTLYRRYAVHLGRLVGCTYTSCVWAVEAVAIRL